MKIEVNGSIEFLPEEPEARRARVEYSTIRWRSSPLGPTPSTG